MTKTNFRLWTSFVLLSLILLGSYYSLTIPNNAFKIDQWKLIEYSQEILRGEFRLVGMRTSHLSWNFPMMHYLLAPFVAISAEPYVNYLVTGMSYLIGIWTIAYFLLKHRSRNEFIVFALLSLTHTWTLFYSSWPSPPFYIPFFLSLFFILFFGYLRNSKKVFLFHLASILLNIIVQLHSLSIMLILAFILCLIVLGKLPKVIHWVIQTAIQFLLISPWVYFHLYVIDWSKEPKYDPALFQYSFLDSLEAMFDFISGRGLLYDHNTNLLYEKLFDPLLTFAGILFSCLALFCLVKIYFVWKSKQFRWKKAYLYLQPYYQEENNPDRFYEISFYLIFVCILGASFLGVNMFPHYYLFLVPVIFLLIALLPGLVKNPLLNKFVWGGIILFTVIQGTFTWVRVYEDNSSPLLTDLNHTQVLAKMVAENCRTEPKIGMITPSGKWGVGDYFYYRFSPEYEKQEKTGTLDCYEIVFFQNKLERIGKVASVYAKQLKPLKKIEWRNNQILFMGKDETL